VKGGLGKRGGFGVTSYKDVLPKELFLQKVAKDTKTDGLNRRKREGTEVKGRAGTGNKVWGFILRFLR
jgi:hypothetical protein